MSPVSILFCATGALGLAIYERAHGALRAHGSPWPTWRRRCWWGAALLLVVAGAPPLGSTSQHSLVDQTLQFGLLAFGVAPLAVLGAPRMMFTGRGLRSDTVSPPSRYAAGVALLVFVVTTIAWRVPPAVDAVASSQSWFIAEAICLIAGTWFFWAAVLGSPPRPAVDPRPLRIALAAFAAWSIWIFAYVVGFTGHSFYPAFATGPAANTPQQVAVIILWATSAAGLLPVAFVNLAAWLGGDQQLAEAEVRRLHRRHVQPLCQRRPVRQP